MGCVLTQKNVDDVLLEPGLVSDSKQHVEAVVPGDITEKYEVHSYRNAAIVLAQTHRELFSELVEMLRSFSITTDDIRRPGGNESVIVKKVSEKLRQSSWHETSISGDLSVRLSWREPSSSHKNPTSVPKESVYVRKGAMGGHKIDYVKGRVAFDMEWNSKDQTYDRDLYAFRAFHEAGAIDVGVILTRGVGLDNSFFRSLGKALNKNGTNSKTETLAKFGASTTWMGKLLYRLEAGRNGGCPVLAVGITPRCVSDWKKT